MADSQQPGMVLLPGISDAISEVNRQLCELARKDVPVFITGEAGTEKAFAAKILCQLSDRADKPLSKLSVTWKLPADIGDRLRICHGGTLIFSLQREFPPDIQYTILEIANDKAYADAHSDEVHEADVRIILTTSIDLATMRGQISLLPELSDLLSRYHIEIPPIRERPEDIPALVRYACQRASETGRSQVRGADAQVLALFRSWTWPGNAEDLLIVTAEAALASTGDWITLDDLPEEFMANIPAEALEQAREVRLPDPPPRTQQVLTPPPSPVVPAPAERPFEPSRPAAPAPAGKASTPGSERKRPMTAAEEEEIPIEELASILDSAGNAGGVDAQPNDMIATAEEIDRNARRMARLLTLAKRLAAQSGVVKSQLEGPVLADKTKKAGPGTTMTDEEIQSMESIADALERQLDAGLDSMLGLRRQLAKLNNREQKAIQTVRDLYRRLILAGIDVTQALGDNQLLEETADLREGLVEMDSIIQRVSGQVSKIRLESSEANAIIDQGTGEHDSISIGEEEFRAVAEILARAEADPDATEIASPGKQPASDAARVPRGQ